MLAVASESVKAQDDPAARPPATNHVLELGGDGDYVLLPPDIFNDFTEATVEGWVKWKSLRRFSRFFDFGTAWQAMEICNEGMSDTLYFSLGRDPFDLDSELRDPRVVGAHAFEGRLEGAGG